MDDLFTESSAVKGAWKLDHFKPLTGDERYTFTEILMFFNRYYSDFQFERGRDASVISHVGIYKLADDAITFQVQLSTRGGDIGKVVTGSYKLINGNLHITIPHGSRPGTWVYNRLE